MKSQMVISCNLKRGRMVKVQINCLKNMVIWLNPIYRYRQESCYRLFNASLGALRYLGYSIRTQHALKMLPRVNVYILFCFTFPCKTGERNTRSLYVGKFLVFSILKSYCCVVVNDSETQSKCTQTRW